MTNSPTHSQTFDQFLKNSLTASDYDNLPTLLGISKRKMTAIKENPTCGTIEQAVTLATQLQLSTKELIDQYQFGYASITVGDYHKLS